jgi:hypothetical protein
MYIVELIGSLNFIVQLEYYTGHRGIKNIGKN